MRTCEKCKSEISKAIQINGAWYCDKCAGSCDYCGTACLLDYLVNGACPDCQNIFDDYEMESFNELLF